MDDVFGSVFPSFGGHNDPLTDTPLYGDSPPTYDYSATKDSKNKPKHTGIIPHETAHQKHTLAPPETGLRPTVDSYTDNPTLSSHISSDTVFIKGNQPTHTAKPDSMLLSKLPSASFKPFTSSMAVPPTSAPLVQSIQTAITTAHPPSVISTIPTAQTILSISTIPTAPTILPISTIPTASSIMTSIMTSSRPTTSSTLLTRSSKLKSSKLPSSSTTNISPFTPNPVNANNVASTQSAPSYTVPIVLGVLAGLLMVGMLAVAVRRMKRNRKNRESWSVYQETPWKDPFRASLDQYHSHY